MGTIEKRDPYPDLDDPIDADYLASKGYALVISIMW
jgi:hypothetical protein